MGCVISTRRGKASLSFSSKSKSQEIERVLLTLPSARADMTFPSADKDLFMFFASSRTVPSAPVLLTCVNKQIRG